MSTTMPVSSEVANDPENLVSRALSRVFTISGRIRGTIFDPADDDEDGSDAED